MFYRPVVVIRMPSKIAYALRLGATFNMLALNGCMEAMPQYLGEALQLKVIILQ